MSLSENTGKTINICFWSVSDRDDKLCQEIETVLGADQCMAVWHALKLLPGDEREMKTKRYLEEAHIVVIMVSPDFTNSPHCNSLGMQQIMQKCHIGQTQVIPVIVRPAMWEDKPFGTLVALPKGGKPIMNWQKRDEALLNVAKGIKRVVIELNAYTDHGQKSTNNVVSEIYESFQGKNDIVENLNKIYIERSKFDKVYPKSLKNLWEYSLVIRMMLIKKSKSRRKW
jgi:hypothetical protein